MKTRTSMMLVVCIAALAFALQMSAVRGAPPAKGTLQGTVTDAVTGLPILGANVAINDGSGTGTTTDTSGSYIFKVVAGAYTVTASKPGYATQTAPVTISSGAITIQNFALVPPLNAVPEIPWGTLAACMAMIVTLAGYIAIPKLKKRT